MRLLAIQAIEPGRYSTSWEEYDAAVYSDTIETEPTTPDTGLPDPFDVPVPTSLAATEEVYQRQDGSYSSRFRITWTADAYPYAHTYQVLISSGGSRVWSAEPREELYVTGALQEGQLYSITVAIVASIGITGTAAQVDLSAQGRQLPPGDVASISGFEAGGTVRLSWLAAVDIDIRWYELRRLASASVTGTNATDWAAAELIDRFDGLRATVQDTPEGDYRFFVKALDSVGNYSANAAYVDVSVTLDTRNFFVGEQVVGYSAADSTNIYQSTARDGTTRQVSEVGTVVDTLFPNAADTYSAHPFWGYDNGAAERVDQ